MRRHHEQTSFLIIVAGGFLLILLIIVSFGAYGPRRLQQLVQNRIVKSTTKETIITIQNHSFTSPVTVKKGTKVTWINNDVSAHTVVADDGSFDLGTVTKDQTKSYTFTTAGTYKYHCSIHPGMEGTVIVE